MADTTSPFRGVLPLPEGDTLLDPPGETLRDAPSARASSPGCLPAEEARRLGDLELLGELARGGMGAVYRALDRRLAREVAVKVVLGGGTDPEERERFEVEARAAARLRHPNIVGIHRVGEERGAPYLVMDLVPGESLQKRLARDGPLRPRDAARLAAKLARALAFAHARGVLHRDLKPHNVLVTPDGEPILTDFGLAKEVERSREITVTGQVLGTPAYMAPEQARGDNERVDRRADVYGLGATLYAALTGRPPFQAGSAIALLARVVEDPVDPPRRTHPDVDRDLETIVLRCLEKEAAARYDTAQDLAEDLERFLAGEPIRARRQGLAERAARWVRRNRLVSALLAGACALAILAAVGARLVVQGRAVDEARAAVLAARAAATEPSLIAATDAPRIEERLGLALTWLQRAQRWSDLAASEEARASQVEAAFALGDAACACAQWSLATQAYGLSGLPADDARRKAASEGIHRAKIERARAALEALASSSSSAAPGSLAVYDSQRAVFDLVRSADRDTVLFLVERLEDATRKLVAARRRVLLDCARPTDLEVAAGWEPLDGLEQALTLLEGDEPPPDGPVVKAARELVDEAARRLGRRRLGPADPWAEVEFAQEQDVGEAGLRQAHACAQALGVVGEGAREQAVVALQGLLRADVSDEGTGHAWRALKALKVEHERLKVLVTTRVGPVALPDVNVEEDASSDTAAGACERVLAALVAGDLVEARARARSARDRWPADMELLRTAAMVELALEGEGEALGLAEEAVRRRRDPVSLTIRARALARAGEPERARGDLEAAERLLEGQADFTFWLQRGTAFCELGDLREGAAALRRACELAPGDLLPAVGLARAQLALGDVEQARSTVAGLTRLAPDNPLVLLLRGELLGYDGSLQEALRLSERARELAPRLVEAPFRQAALLLDLGRLTEAEVVGRDLLDLQAPQGHLVLSQVELQRGRLVLAEEHCARGLKVVTAISARVTMLVLMARIQLQQGRVEAALATADEAVQRAPNEVSALWFRALARSAWGDQEGALRDLDAAVALRPDLAEAYVARAEFHARRGDHAAVRRDCEHVIALRASPKRLTIARQLLAMVAVQRGELDVAVRELDQALELHPRDPNLILFRSAVRLQAGEIAGALADCDVAVREAPGLARGWIRRAALRDKQGDRAGAAADARQALLLRPHQLSDVELLVAVLASIGDVQAARDLIDAALPRQTEPTARHQLERMRARLGR